MADRSVVSIGLGTKNKSEIKLKVSGPVCDRPEVLLPVAALSVNVRVSDELAQILLNIGR